VAINDVIAMAGAAAWRVAAASLRTAAAAAAVRAVPPAPTRVGTDQILVARLGERRS